MITPQDILEKKFKKMFRGYDDMEVDAFLDLVAEDYGRMYEVYGQLQDKLEQLSHELNEARTRALEAEAEKKIAEASLEKEMPPVSCIDMTPIDDDTSLQVKAAEILIKEAESAVLELKENAKIEAEQIIKEAECSAQEMVKQAKIEIRLLETRQQHLQRQIDVFKVRSRTMLKAQLSLLDEEELMVDDDC